MLTYRVYPSVKSTKVLIMGVIVCAVIVCMCDILNHFITEPITDAALSSEVTIFNSWFRAIATSNIKNLLI